ncbi:hypothetical protein JTE90_013442 [Oedothorax gibbosus]|uniref:BEN domain-containing protein n=1 Tax=Oedothorax gibbosus TaxID=931172 RepID=A0AAV6VL56_9ARAC|nr:hypothetical protein JTE90_013442 [Oedothorax gibbosus]
MAHEKEKLQAILKDKKRERKRRFEQDRGEGTSKMSRSCFPRTDSSDEDDLVLKSELEKIKTECDKANRKLKLQELNVRLQDQLLSLLRSTTEQHTNRSLLDIPPPAGENCKKEKNANEGLNLMSVAVEESNPSSTHTTKINDSQDVQVLLVVVEEGYSSSTHTTKVADSQNVQSKDEEMVLAPGVTVRKEKWLQVISGENITESRLVRNLAVTLWGSDTLTERSVTGAPCKRLKNKSENAVEAKQALTPVKVEAVKNALEFWLREHKGKDVGEAQKLSSASSVRKLLSDKIMDLQKQQQQK